MKKVAYIKCEFQQMAQHEVLEMIPADTVNRIRANDPHPEFRVFSVGHEGEANANVIGRGMSVLRYAKDIIVQMFNRMKLGLPTFNRHDPSTNSHANRETVGEVVGKTMKDIGGKLHALAAVYIKPEYREHDLDIASIEGNFEAQDEGGGALGVVNLSAITGIALSNHSKDVPGMPGATLQAALQMFTHTGRMQQMETKEEVKAAIAKLNLKATDFYTVEELLSLEPVKAAKKEEYEWAKRLEKKLGEAGEENAKLQGKVSELQAVNAKLAEKANAGSVRETLAGVATEKKLEPKFVKFIEKNLGAFKSTKDGEEFKNELEKFVDTQAKEYAEMGKLYGFEAKITVEAGKKEGEAGKPAAGAGARSGDGASGSGDGEAGEGEMEDPAKNEFIPKA